VYITIFIVSFSVSLGQTVQSYVNSRGCNTAVVSGLSKQLVQQTNLLQPDLFTDISTLSGVSLSTAAQAVPYLQTAAANALKRVVRNRGSTLNVNSALRTLAQQLLLRKWYEAGACGISAAAQPGLSNHNGGLAVDVQDPYSWVSAMSGGSFHHLGSGDPPHFDYKGAGARDVRSLSVRAFQVLWNANVQSPSDRLPEDGVYSSAVERALLRAPANGFSSGPRDQQPNDVQPIDQQDQQGSFGSCNANGDNGVCIDVNSEFCSGQIFRGFCPGAANIRCCVQSRAMDDDAQSLSTQSTSTSENLAGIVVVIVIGAVIIVLLVVIIVQLSRKLNSYE